MSRRGRSLPLPGPLAPSSCQEFRQRLRPQARAWATQSSSGVVIPCNEAFVQAVRDSKLGPPVVARALVIAEACIYDAWAAI
jgi:hypothetical protein